jgi:hypothetical protein
MAASMPPTACGARSHAPSQVPLPVVSAPVPARLEEVAAAAQQPASQLQPLAAAVPPAPAPTQPPALPALAGLPAPLLAAFMGGQQGHPLLSAIFPGGWPAGLPTLHFLQQAQPPLVQGGTLAPAPAVPAQGVAVPPDLQWLLAQQQLFDLQFPRPQGPL